MIGRLLRSLDFERVLRTRSRASSVHFAVHHVADVPARPAPRLRALESGASSELSTDAAPKLEVPVDEACDIGADALWLGAVVPKRHARRAVTRTLLKRQIRSVVGDRADQLARGLWVVRLRAPFDRQQFPSAASDALRRLARAELEQVLVQAVSRLGGR